MSNNVLISVIVPVYNSEKYIERCINSLKLQIFRDVEYIIVNDGSKDKSLEKIVRIAETDKRFKVINQTNMGVSAARNRGILESKGAFIMFLDSDDALLENNAVGFLCEKMISTDADVIAYGGRLIDSKAFSFNTSFEKKIEIIDAKIKTDSVKRTIGSSKYRTSVWNKVYKKTLIIDNNIRFIDYLSVVSEDKVFNIDVYVNAKKIVLVDELFFQHFFIECSLSHQKKYDNVDGKTLNTIEHCCRILSNSECNGKEVVFWLTYLDCLSICTELLYSINGCSFRNVLKRIVKILQMTEKNRIKYNNTTSIIINLTDDMKKNLFFGVLLKLIKFKAYRLTAFVLLVKSELRKIKGIV